MIIKRSYARSSRPSFVYTSLFLGEVVRGRALVLEVRRCGLWPFSVSCVPWADLLTSLSFCVLCHSTRKQSQTASNSDANTPWCTKSVSPGHASAKKPQGSEKRERKKLGLAEHSSLEQMESCEMSGAFWKISRLSQLLGRLYVLKSSWLVPYSYLKFRCFGCFSPSKTLLVSMFLLSF